MDTIVALASAQGRAGVAVIRVSGPQAWEVCEKLAGFVPPAREARLARLRNSDGETIDSALVLAFAEGSSFTGEKVCEFQVHGSIAVVAAVLRACLFCDGVRAAEAGEFTRRAFLDGRMDLTGVEALADLIDAETDAQRRQALSVMEGAAARVIETWREDLLQALAMLEAALDFSDEELPEDLVNHVLAPLVRVRGGLASQLGGRQAAEAVRSGFEVAIIGPVNAGKSSLLNALSGREAAITSARAGTTRDVIEVRMEIAGLAVTLIDTAGLREAQDEIERIGIERGQSRAAQADLRVFLQGAPGEPAEGVLPGDLVVLSKADIWNAPGISATTGTGLPWLIDEIAARLRTRAASSSVFTRERHFDKLSRAMSRIDGAVDGLHRESSWDLVGEDVKLAIRALDGIIGRVDVEEVLGRIFSSFCIGK
ncbi:MAG: tRNA uridine-5-carboxymethylaminomethyl(34) synthesis GTPase MnmE [Rhodobacteraceae bacterium]|nr:tRNA uridine-5-carboxymethylaminomethyl(34) synthesis GTPase MnmE [Paracoccaceae bacterium]